MSLSRRGLWFIISYIHAINNPAIGSRVFRRLGPGSIGYQSYNLRTFLPARSFEPGRVPVPVLLPIDATKCLDFDVGQKRGKHPKLGGMELGRGSSNDRQKPIGEKMLLKIALW